MKKNVLYLIITLVAVILVALMMNPGSQQEDAATSPEAMPSNGLVNESGDAATAPDAAGIPADAPVDVPEGADTAMPAESGDMETPGFTMEAPPADGAEAPAPAAEVPATTAPAAPAGQ